MRLELHPQQSKALTSTATEILYGGAGGGGKSHLMRVLAVASCIAVPGLRVGLFRRERTDLKANHFQGRTSLPMMVAPLIAAGRVRFNVTELSLAFGNGSLITSRHFQHEADYLGIQGDEYDLLLIDELPHFTEFMYRWMRSRLRTAGLVVPPGITWTFPRVVAGANPGGPGHTWVKAGFIDIAPPMAITRMPDEEGGMLRQFIPAKLIDNPSVKPEEYRQKLAGLGNPTMVKAMLDGDWNIVAGGMFDDVFDQALHVLADTFVAPGSWRISRAFDWGSSKPFSVGWWAESDGTPATVSGKQRTFPKGTLVRIGEWYGWNGKPNQGARMMAADVARGILEREKEAKWTVLPGAADSAIYDAGTGLSNESIGDVMARLGCRFEPANKGAGSRKSGWQRVREMLAAVHPLREGRPMEHAGLFVVGTCRHWLRTVPVTPRDPRNQDDVDSDSEDHAADETRYRVTTPLRIAERLGPGLFSLTR